MSRLLRFAAVAVALVILSGTGCKKNSAPEPPYVQGPSKAGPGDTLTFRFTSEDPEGDNVRYKISWGDGTTDDWSPTSPSDEEYDQTHSYAVANTYYVKAKAKDTKDAESDWSEDSVKVTVGSFAPKAPSRPSGPAKCTTGVTYTFRTEAVHPLGDSVSIRFFWGNAVGNWGPMVGSGDVYAESRRFDTSGVKMIAAQAKDASGLESDWSDSLTVVVDTVHVNPSGAPTNLKLVADSDSTVKLTWSAPVDSTPGWYLVSFREVGTASYDSIASCTLALSYVHTPAYRTGHYQVTSVFTSTRSTSIETPSTIPVWSGVLQVPELSGTGRTGFGWLRSNGTATLYDMTTADSAAKVDFYVTDFAQGFAGPKYYAASPDTAPLDPGGTVPGGNWNMTMFSHLDSLAGEDSILPRWTASITRYRRAKSLDSLPRLVAGYTADGHYALLRVTNVDTTLGKVTLETWFQLIPNLRLIEH